VHLGLLSVLAITLVCLSVLFLCVSALVLWVEASPYALASVPLRHAVRSAASGKGGLWLVGLFVSMAFPRAGDSCCDGACARRVDPVAPARVTPPPDMI